jgi:hypothetical protein
MRWKHRRVLYQAEVWAYVRHLLEQHGRHIFEESLLDEAPGGNVREKLTFLLHSEQDRIYVGLSRSILHRLRRIREQEIARGLRWQRKHYPGMGRELDRS